MQKVFFVFLNSAILLNSGWFSLENIETLVLNLPLEVFIKNLLRYGPSFLCFSSLKLTTNETSLPNYLSWSECWRAVGTTRNYWRLFALGTGKNLAIAEFRAKASEEFSNQFSRPSAVQNEGFCWKKSNPRSSAELPSNLRTHMLRAGCLAERRVFADFYQEWEKSLLVKMSVLQAVFFLLGVRIFHKPQKGKIVIQNFLSENPI